MSGFPIDAKLVNVPQDDGPPRHHMHNSNDPLPGSHVDQEPAEVQQRSDKDLSQEEAALRAQGHNAFNSERPLDVHPVRAGKCRRPISGSITDAIALAQLTGGVARAGDDDLPMGKASILDKAVGKMEKVKVLDFWPFLCSDTERGM